MRATHVGDFKDRRGEIEGMRGQKRVMGNRKAGINTRESVCEKEKESCEGMQRRSAKQMEMMIKTSGLSGGMTSRSTEWSRMVLVCFLIEWIGLNGFTLFNNIS